MLDHNITADTFEKYKSKLEETKKKWERYDGKIDIITEKDVVKILNIDKKNKPVLNYDLKIKEATSNNDSFFLPFRENSIYYINGEKKETNGFWINTTYEKNELYAYEITKGGRNSIRKKDAKNGIRPVITVNKSLVTDDNISELEIKKAYNYKKVQKVENKKIICKQITR